MVLYKQALDDWQSITQSELPTAREAHYGVAEPSAAKKKNRSKRLKH